MRILEGAAAEAQLNATNPQPPNKDVSGDVMVVHEFYIRAARCKIIRPNSGDLVAAWSDATAILRFIQIMPGESVLVQPTGLCAVYSQYAILTVSPQVNEIVDFLEGGQIALEQYALAASVTLGTTPTCITFLSPPSYESTGDITWPLGAPLALKTLFDRLPFTGIPAATNRPS